MGVRKEMRFNFSLLNFDTSTIRGTGTVDRARVIFLLAASIVLGLSGQARSQDEEQPVFSVPNSADAKLGEIRPEKIKLQPAPNPTLNFGRDSLEMQSALKPLSSKFAKSTVVIETKYGHRSLGTVVSKQGFIVAKHSELNVDEFFCHIGGEKVAGQSLAYHKFHDIVLIQVDPSHLKDAEPISFLQNQTRSMMGRMVVSIGKEETSAKLGVVSVLPQRFNIQQPTLEDGIDLGLTVSPFVVSKRIPDSDSSKVLQGLEVRRVYPRSVSERTGLYVGDLLQSINGVSLATRYELEKFAKTLRVGQRVSVKVLRDGKPMTLSTRINSFAPRMLHDRWGGGPFSDRRFGFHQVISHDSVIDPEQCGGPLVDLEGNVLGINIARAMRVASFAIPLHEVENFVRYVKPEIELVYNR